MTHSCVTSFFIKEKERLLLLLCTGRTPPYGSTRDLAFDDAVDVQQQIVGIRALRINSRLWIYAIQATYILADGTTTVAPSRGITEGGEDHITFSDGEVITEVQGWTTSDNGFLVRLIFITNMGTYGPYGPTLVPFTLREQVIAFYGRQGGGVDAIGFYYLSKFSDKVAIVHACSSHMCTKEC